MLGAVGAIFLLCIAGIAALIAGGDGEDTAPESGPATTAANPRTTEPKKTEPGIGTPVRDGKFEFVVKKVQCDVKTVGSETLGKSAQGQFCLVTITVKNIGSVSQTMNDFDQRGIGSNGAEYQTDSEAGLYVNSENQSVWLTEINPGNQVTGILVFDLPADMRLAKVELHDSAFSGGVRVSVR